MKNIFYLILTLFTFQSLLAQVPSTGLIAYYPFNGNANDISGYANNGIAYNTTLTTDRSGITNNAYYFNGTSSYIDLGIDSIINSVLGDFSISYWVKSDSTGGVIIACYSNQAGSAWRFISRVGGTVTSGAGGTPNGAALTNFKVSGTWQVTLTAANLVSYLQWNNVVFTRNGTTTNVYINGSLTYSATVSAGNIDNPTTPKATTRIGYNFPSNNEYYKGSLDDLAIYNRALSQQEVTQIYNANGTCFFYDTIQVYDTITVHNVINDTTHVTVYDTTFTSLSVTDTLLINVNLTGIVPPTNTNTIAVYPNPAHSHITINNGNLTSMAGYSIKITNALGQVVFNQLVNQQQFYVDVTAWGGNGFYLLYVMDSQQSVKSIKQIVLH